MKDQGILKSLYRIRKAFCVVWLVLLLLSEGYSAATTSLDPHIPHWERVVGWGMFALPCSMILGLALLFHGEQQRLGFYSVIASLSLYIGFIGLDTVRSGMGIAEWIDMSLWAMFCAIGMGAARALMVKSLRT